MRVLAGRYELVEKVGEGGMSVVWRARDARLERDVAVKLLRPFVAPEEDRRRRFAREARTLAALSSDHIVRVHDYVEADAEAFLVMEFVDGCEPRRRDLPPAAVAVERGRLVRGGRSARRSTTRTRRASSTAT